ncbi:hypothetical protein ACFWBS_03185 [Streptomyces mirabilis]
MERLVEEIPVLGLLGFHDELDHRTGRPNGSMRDAVQPVGEPDEAELVAYLDACQVLIDVMEAGRDVITGSSHRHSSGCSSLVTDGTWLWRRDFPHYVETHHVPVGWASAVPWRSTATTLVPEPRAVTRKTPFDAATLAHERNRPHGSWGRPRKPRKT